MDIFWRALLAVALMGLCGKASADAHLFRDESALLHSGSVTVLFLEPETELGAYLKVNSQMNLPPGGGAIGGAGSSIATGIIDSHHINEFVEAMQPYADQIGKQRFTDQEYTLIHDVLGAQPWMQKADWQRLPEGTDRRRVMSMMKSLHTQAALLITAETLIRNDLDQMQVGYRIEIFVKDPYEDYGVKRLRNTDLIRLSPDPASDAFPALDYLHTGVDEATTQNLQTFFADGGTHLTQYFQGALSTLRSQLTYYFTGVMPPAPATQAVTQPAPAHP
jgi:hypothetical protein